MGSLQHSNFQYRSTLFLVSQVCVTSSVQQVIKVSASFANVKKKIPQISANGNIKLYFQLFGQMIGNCRFCAFCAFGGNPLLSLAAVTLGYQLSCNTESNRVRCGKQSVNVNTLQDPTPPRFSYHFHFSRFVILKRQQTTLVKGRELLNWRPF